MNKKHKFQKNLYAHKFAHLDVLFQWGFIDRSRMHRVTNFFSVSFGPHNRPTAHIILYVIEKFEIQFSLLDNTRPNIPHSTRSEENIPPVAQSIRDDREESIHRRSQQLVVCNNLAYFT